MRVRAVLGVFENARIRGSGGIVYVDPPDGWPTPSLTANNS
jgi:hypothetical protein